MSFQHKTDYLVSSSHQKGTFTRHFIYFAALIALLVNRPMLAGTWTPLTHTAPDGINTMLLLSDGTVMAAGTTSTKAWYQLTPDGQGSYTNGTWSSLAPMNDTRLYYSSDVLTNGRVFVAGAEYGTGTNSAEVYDPVSNTWARTAPPPAGQTLFYDSISKMLPGGNVLIAPVGPATSGGTVIFVTASNTWRTGGTLFRGSYQDEASWVKLPDDSILTIDPFGQNSERYIPSLNQWVNDGTVPVALYDPFGEELGGAFLLPDGRAFFLGATGNTALYTPSGNLSAGTWAAGPVIPNGQGTPDAPAAMMVNGNILCAVSPAPTSANHFPSPVSFYEYDPVANVFTQVNGPTGLTYPDSSYVLRMLDLPDGTVLLATSGSQLYIYQPSGSPLAAGKPAINSVTQNSDGSFHVSGTGMNGISEGAAYGDDAQMDSNYPIGRLLNTNNGAVYYLRTFAWNSTSVMTGNRVVTTEFSLPINLPLGDYSLLISANGNASDPWAFSTATLPPVILKQPQSMTVGAGSSATFSVQAAGTPLTYAWQMNGSLVPGATSSSFTTNNVQVSDSGSTIRCAVSNANGGAFSSDAVLTVIPGFPPGITAQPVSQTVPVGGTASFSLTATSNVPAAYFWRRNGGFIPGATNSTYTTNNVQLADSGAQFSCIVSNPFGTVTSSNALLTVQQGPSNDLCSGAFVITGTTYSNTQSTTLATSTGDPVPSCVSSFRNGVWYIFTPPANGTVVVDTIGSSYDTVLGTYVGSCGSLTQVGCDDDSAGNQKSIITNAVTAGAAYFVLAGGYNGATGTLALHLVFTAIANSPTITTQPANQTIGSGGSATFSVAASGATPLSYFWRRNGNFILSATNSTYTTNNVQLADSGAQFSCLVSNVYGTALSSNATLIVNTSLVQNGGFELGNFSSWTTGGNFASSTVGTNSPYVHSGTYGARLGPVGNLGLLSQSIPTTAGSNYLLSCWLYSTNQTPNEFRVSWNSIVVFDQVNVPNVGWTNLIFSVVGAANSTTLQFGFRNDPAYLGLDDVSVTLVPVVRFQSIVQTNGTVLLTWNAQAGQVYQVQYKTNLSQPIWFDLGLPVTASGAVASVTELIGPDPLQFFRLRLFP